jgi:hypothetical protein
MVKSMRYLIFLACLFSAGTTFAQGGACPTGANYVNSSAQLVTLSSLGVTSCYYASKSTGNDSNAGTSESAPWAHLPGMSGCSGKCAAVTPTGGDGFIMRGGDTWTASGDFTSLQLTYSGGSAGSQMYWGVDPNWYSGSSFTRPIMNCNGSQCQSSVGSGGSNGYITLDNVEITGFEQTSTSGNPAVVGVNGPNSGVTRSYIHNFTTNNNATHSNALFSQTVGNGAAGSYFVQNVIDGSDSTQTFMGGILHGSVVAENVIRYTYNGFNGGTDQFWGNFIEHNYASGDGDHCNMAFIQGPFSASNVLVYNNVIQHTTCAGSVTLWLGGLSCGSYNGYAFNNVVWDTQGGNVINPPGQVGGCTTQRTWNFFNNTVECGPDSGPSATCFSDSGDIGQADVGTINFINDQWITSSNPFSCSVLTCNSTTSLTQTQGAASGQGYSGSEPYAFSPPSGCSASGCSTIQAGIVELALCATLTAVNSAAATACQNDTAYSVGYNTTNHTVTIPGRTSNPRSGSAWDIGAYQSGKSPAAPVQLKTTVAPQ